jgi:hypothetical protein
MARTTKTGRGTARPKAKPATVRKRQASVKLKKPGRPKATAKPKRAQAGKPKKNITERIESLEETRKEQC